MYKLSLKIDQLPKSLNKALRSHYFISNKQNQIWDRDIMLLIGHRLPDTPLKKAHIRIVRHFYRMLDYDGLVGSLKPVVDALVSAGVLESDSWQVLGQWDVDQVFRPKKDGPLLEITITQG